MKYARKNQIVHCLTTSIGNKSKILGEVLDSCFVNIWIKVRSRNKSKILLEEVLDSCFANIWIKVRSRNKSTILGEVLDSYFVNIWIKDQETNLKF